MEKKMQKFDVVDEKIDNMNNIMKSFISSCEEKDKKFVSKEIFETKLTSLSKQIAIYAGIGIFVINIIVNYFTDKIK